MPAVGDSLITLPVATVELACWVTVPTTRPALVIAVVAAAWLCPTTLGTATFAGPDEITKLNELGIDGILISWFDFHDGLERFNEGVLPLLEQRGLREPFRPT